MKVTRYVNSRKIEGAMPPLLVKNQGILEIYRHREKALKASTQPKRKEL